MEESEDLMKKGEEFIDKKDDEQAIMCFRKLVERYPNNFRVWYMMGRSYINLEDYDEGIICLEKACSIDPNHLNACLELGDVYRKIKEPHKAIRQINKAVIIKDKDEHDWFKIGCAYNDLNQYGEAVGCLKKAVEINPKMKKAWYNLGIIHGDYLGDPVWAIQYYEKLLAIDNSRSLLNAYALLKLHKEYNSVGDTKKANEFLFKGDSMLNALLMKRMQI